jgi:hypothetical protein
MLEAGNCGPNPTPDESFSVVGLAYTSWLKVLCLPSPLSWTDRLGLWNEPIRHINISKIIGDLLRELFPADLDAVKMVKNGSYPPADLALFLSVVLKIGQVKLDLAPCFLAWAYACDAGDLIGTISYTLQPEDAESHSLLHERMEKLRVSLGLEHLYQLRDTKPKPLPGTEIPDAKKQTSGWDIVTPPPAKRARIESK